MGNIDTKIKHKQKDGNPAETSEKKSSSKTNEDKENRTKKGTNQKPLQPIPTFEINNTNKNILTEQSSTTPTSKRNTVGNDFNNKANMNIVSKEKNSKTLNENQIPISSEETNTIRGGKKKSTKEHMEISKINFEGSLNKDIREYYKFKDVLGGGNFGTVRVAYRRNEVSKRYFAIKSIKKAELTFNDIKNLTKEVQILSSLDHPNIIKFYETYNDSQYFHIVMELCTGKEVIEKIVEEGIISEGKVANIIFKLLRAICYCHSQGVSHRDIKPENILFYSKDCDSEIKLIDFGLSRVYNEEEKMHTVLGTPYYVAPDVLKGEYNNKCDIWSIGAITFTMLSGNTPFSGNSNNIIFEKIINEEVSFESEKWKNISKEAKDFIRNCMIKDPAHRPTASQALELEWFKQINTSTHRLEEFEKKILENLKKYNEPSKFKKLVYKFLIRLVSSTETKKLKIAFNAIDINNEGFICIKDLETAFENAKIKVSQEELEKIILNGGEDKKFDYTEFVLAAINQKDFQKDCLISAFNYFDIDNSGFICNEDIKNALLRLGKDEIKEDEIEKMISEEQGNKGKISLDDFIKMFS